MSAPAGLPTWTGLRNILQKNAEDRAQHLTQIGEQVIIHKTSSARKHPNMWVAFKLLKEILTNPVFQSLIENNLEGPQNSAIPAGYSEIMRLQPTGVVTLNLDNYAGEAFARSEHTSLITPIYGKELAQRWTLIQSLKRYLVYLHGGLHDPSTWVLTQDDLDDISSSIGHGQFLRDLYLNNIVLFVGVSAEDISLSQRLLDLVEGGFRPKHLYWLTTRLDPEIERWANDSYVSMIRYSALNSADHIKTIKLLVDDCTSFISKDEVETPLVRADVEIVPEQLENITPDDLAQKEPELIRQIISKILNKSLVEAIDKDDQIATYRQFCELYDYPVHRSFYRAKAEKFRNWFGYKLDMPSLGRGNFGEVYSAQKDDGSPVAVKIMHESIFGNDDMLGGFRRGVRSMRIVTTNNVPGMVPILESYELPPTIIMPFVEGVSLEDALLARPNLPWLTKLDVAIGVGEIVAAGHALPQTVLHRDLKPSNIMIKNFEYHGSFKPEVIVLDFDMSWHKGSKEKDIVFESRDDIGYLAPEQTDASHNVSARSTRVDSYGFGMTIYFIFGCESPRSNEALSDRWLEKTIRAVKRDYSDNWLSAPFRLGRIISQATQIDQNERIDFATILREMKFLRSAITSEASMSNPDLWAEEILARLSEGRSYLWNDDQSRGTTETPSGLKVTVSSNPRSGNINLDIEYADRGMRERSHLGKYLSNSAMNANKYFSSSGWHITESSVTASEVRIKTFCAVTSIQRDKEGMAGAAARAVRSFMLS